MGCICSKGAKSHRYEETDGNEKEIKLSKSSKNLSALSKRNATSGAEADGKDTASLISNNAAASGSTPVSSDEGEHKLVVSNKAARPQLKRGASVNVGANVGVAQVNMPGIITMPNGEKGAQVVAGWPSWLVAVAGEAINGWVPRKADSFEKMDKIGQGTYSSVYKAREVESNKLVALKKVRFTTMDPESVRFMAREIIVLRRLDHPNVMKLEGLITSRASGSVYLIFEYMEHDLAGLASTSGIKFNESQIKCYMQQLLSGLEHCHSRGILHRDIKGSNLLIDNNGILKIGDFGLATIFSANQRQPLTSRVVTLWYRPPELLLGATNYGVAVDLWSTGCILAELFAGKPIMPGRTEVEQLHKIFKLCGSPSEEYWKRSKLPHATIFKPQHQYKRCVRETFNDFPSSTLALLDILLAVEPELRGTTLLALQSEFFTTNPCPCHPSTLPRYPPSKEFDVKTRNEAASRRRAADSKGRGNDSAKGISKESKAHPAPDANAELQVSTQKRRGQANPTSVSEKFDPEENGDSGFPIEPSRGTALDAHPHSGWSTNSNASNSSRNVDSHGTEMRRQGMHHGASQLSRFSNSVAVRGSSKYDNINHQWTEENLNGSYDADEKHDESHNMLAKQQFLDRNVLPADPEDYDSNSRIHYSGPLLPATGNLDEILKEHEKRIQHAVRKSLLDKAKTRTKKSYGGNDQIESLLKSVGNGR